MLRFEILKNMKKRSNEQSISEAIRYMIKDLGIEEKMLEEETIAHWHQFMGDWIEKYTDKVYVKNRVLFVKINSDSLRNELIYGRSKIIQHINESLKQDFLKEVIIS